MVRKKAKEGARSWPLVVSAVGLGLVAALFAALYLKSREASLREFFAGEETREISVVVANADLPKGAAVTPEFFAVRNVPADFVHDDAVRPGEFELYQGRAITAVIGAGKPLLKSFLDTEFPVDFSDLVAAGRRALTVTVDEVNSVAGLIRPGNHVDLYVNIPYSESGFSPVAAAAGIAQAVPASIQAQIPPELLSQGGDLAAQLMSLAAPGDVILPVLQDVRVLATGRQPVDETLDELRQPQGQLEQQFSSLTLDLSPRQAALITAAEDKGSLLALLRNRDDRGGADFTTVSSRDLFANAERMALAEAERRTRVSSVGGVDANGNIVDENGNKIDCGDAFAAAGFTTVAGEGIFDAEGNAVEPDDLIVTQDCQVMSRKQLAERGLTVNAGGQIVNDRGEVVDPGSIVQLPGGGSVTEQELAKLGLRRNENGEIVNERGEVVDPATLVQLPGGGVTTEAELAKLGLKRNENGDIVNEKGEVVDPATLVQLPGGGITTDAELASLGLRRNENGEIVNEKGEVLSGEAVSALLGRPPPGPGGAPGMEAIARAAAEAAERALGVDMIIGGASEDGVAKLRKLPIAE